MARMWQFPHQTLPCPHQSWSHEYGNNGESFYQRRRSNFLWFSPRSIHRRCCPSDSIFKRGKWIFLNQVGLYLRKERILRRPPLVCEGGLYGGSCPPLLKAATLSEDLSPHNNNNGVLCAVTIFTTPPIMGQCFQSVILRQN